MMIRLTELRLPLEHTAKELEAAILQRLAFEPVKLRATHVFKRSPDARKKNALQFVYSLDVEVTDEAAVLGRFADDLHVRPTPDMSYRFVTQAPRTNFLRPVVVGFGPSR